MDAARVAQYAQAGAYDADHIIGATPEAHSVFRLPALALAIRCANRHHPTGGDFEGVLSALVARRGVAFLSAPLRLTRGHRCITMTPLTLVVTRYLDFSIPPYVTTAAAAGRTLRALLVAGADATAPTLWTEEVGGGGPDVFPACSLPAKVLQHSFAEELPHMLLPLLEHGARRLPALDPPNLWRGEPRGLSSRRTILEFLCAFADDRPELVQYVRDCGENLLPDFVDTVTPSSWTETVVHARVHTLSATYGFEITDALLARAARAEEDAAEFAANSTSYNDQQEARTATIIRQALEKERGDRRIEAIQLQRALVARRGLPPEIAHAILRAAGGARPASGAAEWNAAHHAAAAAAEGGAEEEGAAP